MLPIHFVYLALQLALFSSYMQILAFTLLCHIAVVQSFDL